MLTLFKVIASIGYFFLIEDPSLRWLVACLARLVSELVKYLCDSVIGLIEFLGGSVIGLARLVSELVKYLCDSVIVLVECLGDSVIGLVRCLCGLVKVSSFSFPSLLAAPLNSAFIRQFVVTLAAITAIGLAFVFAIFLDRDERRQTLRCLGEDDGCGR